MSFIKLCKGSLCLELCQPGTYYEGTRFDWSGVFRRISKGDCVFADEWFDGDDPKVHDHVCGPSEEFLTVSFDDVKPGELFVKPGVGLLRRPDDAPYDWFRLYEIVDGGDRSLSVTENSALFRQSLHGFYDYEKEVALLSEDSFVIRHRLSWHSGKILSGYTYNHNFFTFNGAPTGPQRRLDFPFEPCGEWRAPYENVCLKDHGIRFSAPIIPPQPSVYMGNLHDSAGLNPCSFRVSEGNASVDVNAYVLANASVNAGVPLDGDGVSVRPEASERPASFSKIVFWANPRVACIEPYLPVCLHEGETMEWTITYRLSC